MKDLKSAIAYIETIKNDKQRNYAERLLEYKHVLVRREEPDPRSFGWRELV